MNDVSVTPTEYAIGGKLLHCTVHMDISNRAKMADDDFVVEIKKKVAKMLAEKLVEDKFIEFTYMHDYTTDGVMVNGRVIVMPDTQVRIVRKLNQVELK